MVENKNLLTSGMDQLAELLWLLIHSQVLFYLFIFLIYFMVIKMCFIINMEHDNTMLINKYDGLNFFNRFQFLKGVVCRQKCQP